ncbi:MAG: hypothetical protein M3P24_07750, partial [Gemmatimonadota bacterium]|nr:hypothetical protein [Gemmatimonadota bacterium]
MRLNRYLAVGALMGAIAGCSDLGLEVENPNNPDRQRVLANPSDVEGLASGQFQQVVSATLGSTERTQLSMMTMAFENASGLNNNGMGPRSIMPRGPIDNTRGNQYAGENFIPWRILSSVGRNTADILARANAPSFTLGAGREGDLNRLKAWTHFMSGVAHGYLSLTYDSVGIARPSDAPGDVPPLVGYQEANSFALAQFDSALLHLQRPGTTALPVGWLTGPGGGTVSVARFAQVVRSFRARMRAGVARTPQERAAVNWEQVIADATGGIDSDLVVGMNRNQNWDFSWLSSTLHFRDVNWHQMPYHVIGMADVSGAFETWLSQPRDSRVPLLIVTPDLRFPQGSTRTAQNADRGGQVQPTGRKYFRNRAPGLDAAGVGWGNSQYDHYRFRYYADANGVADLPVFTRAENDMLAAEGHIRRGSIPAAAALIDRTRTTAGLPALSGAVTTATQAVPGGASCV